MERLAAVSSFSGVIDGRARILPFRRHCEPARRARQSVGESVLAREIASSLGVSSSSGVIARRPARPGNEATHRSRSSILKADGLLRSARNDANIVVIASKMEAA